MTIDTAAAPVPLSRRERVRAATVEEIKAAARRLLVAEGTQGVSLRAIARDLGLSAPALYRYFPSLEELQQALITDYYDEMTADLRAASDAPPADDLSMRLLAVCRAFRGWAVAHPAEFGLVFGTPLPDVTIDEAAQLPCHQAGMRFAQVFIELYTALWQTRPFPVPDKLDPRLATQLPKGMEAASALPIPAMYVMLSCWARLYGLVCMEVFGHLRWKLEDAEPFFEAQLGEVATQLGLI